MNNYFFYATFGDSEKIHGIINTTIKVKKFEDLNLVEKMICDKYNLSEQQRKSFYFTSFNKI